MIWQSCNAFLLRASRQPRHPEHHYSRLHELWCSYVRCVRLTYRSSGVLMTFLVYMFSLCLHQRLGHSQALHISSEKQDIRFREPLNHSLFGYIWHRIRWICVHFPDQNTLIVRLWPSACFHLDTAVINKIQTIDGRGNIWFLMSLRLCSCASAYTVWPWI